MSASFGVVTQLTDEMARMKALNDEMLEALKAGAKQLREEISEGGGCDHSVGICWCDVGRIADQMDAVIAKAEGRQP